MPAATTSGKSETGSRAAQLKASLAGPGGNSLAEHKPKSVSINVRRNKARTNNYLSKLVDRKQNSSVNVNNPRGEKKPQHPEDRDYQVYVAPIRQLIEYKLNKRTFNIFRLNVNSTFS